MLTITKPINNILYYNFKNYSKEEILFFDIETTGFSPDTSTLYLIGCVYYKENTWNYIQWFADKKDDEINILNSFFDFMKDYKMLISFNGEGFDIPYITKKCIKYNLIYNFGKILSFDLIKKIKPYKKNLGLNNCKQKTIEEFLNLKREDTYNGGELINVYKKYIKLSTLDNKSSKTTADTLLKLLLCHNKDDICDMLYLTRILDYIDILSGNFTILSIDDISLLDTHNNKENINILYNQVNTFDTTSTNQSSINTFDTTSTNQSRINTFDKFTIQITLTTNKSLNRIFTNTNEIRTICIKENILTIKVPLINTTLKYFFENYKDYYYLTKEDMAVHKSIAEYVDKTYRQKAKASNCYTKKTSYFIPQKDKNFSPYFVKEYKDKLTYVELTQKQISDEEFIKKYIYNIM